MSDYRRQTRHQDDRAAVATGDAGAKPDGIERQSRGTVTLGVWVTWEDRWVSTLTASYQGQACANQLLRRRPRPGDKWHLGEMFVKINGTLCYLWRVVDQHANVLDVLVQSPRNAKAAKRFFRKLLKGLRDVPRALVTDNLASYGVAHRELMASVEHRRSPYLNNRAENSHRPPGNANER